MWQWALNCLPPPPARPLPEWPLQQRCPEVGKQQAACARGAQPHGEILLLAILGGHRHAQQGGLGTWAQAALLHLCSQQLLQGVVHAFLQGAGRRATPWTAQHHCAQATALLGTAGSHSLGLGVHDRM